jgi:hypothetical protein
MGSIIFSSCAAFHDGAMVPSTSLNAANFNYIGQANGNASAMYFLGIGGLDKSTLVGNAKLQMMRKFPLKSNQAHANVMVKSVRAIDGQDVPLFGGSMYKEGEDKQVLSIVAGLVCFPFGFLIKENNAELPSGTSVSASAATSVTIELN